MKVFLKILFLLLVPAISFPQDNINNDTSWTFTRIVQMDSSNQLTLFGRANEWFVKNGYTKSKSFVNENSTGKLSSVIKIANDPDAGDTYCHILFIAKDGKYKVELSDFFNATWGHLNQDKSDKYMGFRAPAKKWEKLKTEARKVTPLILDGFIQFMANEKKENDF
jgi:hypothetical protein